MPYPNYHSCRIVKPDKFQRGSLRTVTRRLKGGRRLLMLIGKRRGASTTSLQSFRYPKKEWSVREARAHCKRHGGRFLAAGEPEPD